MSLRDALARIHAQHDGMAWVGVVIECQCPDRPLFPDRTAHAAHVADLQIAYLRDNLGQHADELGMTPMCAPVVVDDDGHTWPAWNTWYDDRRHAVKATADSPWSVLGVAYSTDWSRADD